MTADKPKFKPSPLEHPEIDEIWFWDGDYGHVLGCVEGKEEKWLVERGVLKSEDNSQPGVDNLMVGDIVYRIRTVHALERGTDGRELFFQWSLVNTITGAEYPRPV